MHYDLEDINDARYDGGAAELRGGTTTRGTGHLRIDAQPSDIRIPTMTYAGPACSEARSMVAHSTMKESHGDPNATSASIQGFSALIHFRSGTAHFIRCCCDRQEPCLRYSTRPVMFVSGVSHFTHAGKVSNEAQNPGRIIMPARAYEPSLGASTHPWGGFRRRAGELCRSR